MADIKESIMNLASGEASRSPRRPRHRSNVEVNPAVAQVQSTLSTEKTIGDLRDQVNELKEKAGVHEELMPVSKQLVKFRHAHIDPALIDVSPHNKRIQSLLTPIAVNDILASIKTSGQQRPGVLRPKGEGRYELVDGSRRLFCVQLIGGKDYYAKIGDIPDEDIEALSDIGNQTLVISDYELGLKYLELLPNFRDEKSLTRHLAHAEQVSESTIYRRLRVAKLPSWLVELYPTPNDIQVSEATTLANSCNDPAKEAALRSKAEELTRRKKILYEENQVILSPSDILRELKAALKQKKPQPDRTVLKTINGREVATHRHDPKKNLHVYSFKNLDAATLERLHKVIKDMLA